MNRFNPVGDHLAGRFRGLVNKNALLAPVIVDLDRHNLDIDRDGFIKFVLKVLRWLKCEFPEVNWAAAETNPKNGSTKIWGFKGTQLFSMNEAKNIASTIKDEFGVEVYPVNPQMLLPMRRDKITIMSSGVLSRCKKYWLVKSRYENKKHRQYYRTYSAIDFLNNLNSLNPIDESALLRALKWSTKKSIGQLIPHNIEDEQFRTIYQRVDCKTEMEKFWDFDFNQPKAEFQDARKMILVDLFGNRNHLQVISNAVRHYLTDKRTVTVNEGSQKTHLNSATVIEHPESVVDLPERSFDYSKFLSLIHI